MSLAGLWCVSLGFSEERLTQAAARQMSTLPNYHEFAHKSHDVAIELAERLLGTLPVKMSKVFFQNSGSEANDTAMKMVWYYWNAMGMYRKKKIISRIRGYHGVTVATAGLTGLPDNHRDFDLPLPNIRHVECPHHYRYGKPGESEDPWLRGRDVANESPPIEDEVCVLDDALVSLHHAVGFQGVLAERFPYCLPCVVARMYCVPEFCSH